MFLQHYYNEKNGLFRCISELPDEEAVEIRHNMARYLVATDDISRNADPIKWDGELIDGIIRPRQSGKTVRYRPSGRVKKDREGHIAVNPDKPLIIEGSGAAIKTLRVFAAYTIWIDAEPELARARVIERDLAQKVFRSN